MNNRSKIFGIGLPRTGTTSLHRALTILGINSKNFPFKLYTTPDSPILNNYRAFVDSPIPMIYKELDREFPGSKFILTTRSLETWLESMKWLFAHGSVKWKWTTQIHRYHKQFLGSDIFNKKIFERKYHDYHTDVGNYFKNRQKDLLIINIEKEPEFSDLCNFLEVPLVECEYPRSNKRTHVPFHKRVVYHHLIRNIQKAKLYFYSHD